MNISKGVISEDNNISFNCPQCNTHIKVPLARIGHRYHCKVKCACGYVFVAEIEFRERLRKQVDLNGAYELARRQTSGREMLPGNCRIIDLSRTGIGFLTSLDHPLQPGDPIQLRFQLDNTAKTEINQECEVVHVKDNFVGCRLNSENASLGFYLLG